MIEMKKIIIFCLIICMICVLVTLESIMFDKLQDDYNKHIDNFCNECRKNTTNFYYECKLQNRSYYRERFDGTSDYQAICMQGSSCKIGFGECGYYDLYDMQHPLVEYLYDKSEHQIREQCIIKFKPFKVIFTEDFETD